MKKIGIALIVFLTFLNCTSKEPNLFSDKALNDTFLTLDADEITFNEILQKREGKKILVNVWASWCRDCIEALPDEKKLQEKFPEVVFLHLSLDKNTEDWKSGIDRLKIKGDHYFMQSGWKGDFGDFLSLSWIPRYLVIDEKGNIILFNATKPTDDSLIKSLEK